MIMIQILLSFYWLNGTWEAQNHLLPQEDPVDSPRESFLQEDSLSWSAVYYPSIRSVLTTAMISLLPHVDDLFSALQNANIRIRVFL